MSLSQRISDLMHTNRPYLGDGGLETVLIFHEGIELPEFAAFVQLDNEQGRVRLDRYYQKYLMVAKEFGTGFVLDTPTWRANTAWGNVMGLDGDAITEINRNAVDYGNRLRLSWESNALPIVLNGTVGPAGDGYSISVTLSPQKAKDIHLTQITALANAGADMVTAMTMTYAEETIGMVFAAQTVDIPITIGFTVETDGRLPSGQTIGDAIEQVDQATGAEPLYYMINCAHPEHFNDVLSNGAGWLTRIGAIRANASRMSHAELDDAAILDEGNPAELAQEYKKLQAILPQLKVLGGCCGTDHRHVHAIGHACAAKHEAT